MSNSGAAHVTKERIVMLCEPPRGMGVGRAHPIPKAAAKLSIGLGVFGLLEESDRAHEVEVEHLGPD
jgi:hypothetical protein